MPDLVGRLSVMHKVKRLQKKFPRVIAGPSGGPSSSPPRARRKSATPGGTSSLVDPPSPPTKAKVQKLSWFERTMLCMQISVHQENYEAYRERKQIIHNQGVLLKEIEKVSGKGKAPRGSDDEDGSADSVESDATIPYAKWGCDSVQWSAFGDLSAQFSSSVRIGDQSTSSRAAAADDDAKDSGDEDSPYSKDADEDDEDSE